MAPEQVLTALIRTARRELRQGSEPRGRSAASVASELGISHGKARQLLLGRLAPVLDIEVDDVHREHSGRRGPASDVFRLRRDVGAVAALHFDHHLDRVGLYDIHGRPLPKDVKPWCSRSAAATPPTQRVETAAVAMDELWQAAGSPPLVGVGIAIAASVDPASGAIRDLTGMPGWGGLVLADVIAQRTGWSAPPLVGTHAALAALAEQWWGAARSAHTSVYVEWSEGIAGGLVINGRPFAGAHGAAGQFGHQRVLHAGGGERCPRCERFGCLESVAAEAAVCAAAGVPHSATALIERLKRDDIDAHVAVRDAAQHVGQALGGIANLLDPDMIVLGGSIGRRAYHWTRESVRRGVQDRYRPAGSQPVGLMRAQRGQHAALEGAAAHVLLHRRLPFLVERAQV